MPEEKIPPSSLEKIRQEFQEQAAKEKEGGLSITPEKKREILEGIIEKHRELAPPSPLLPGHEVDEYERTLAKEPHEEQTKKLLQIANEKGIFNAYKIMERLYKSEPHYIDDFHRALIHYFGPQAD